eukprot:scaffold4165_cov217-Skeletonema_menzelii.AAC.1
MDLPEEDAIALRKRSAIQSVMKDKSLSGTQRHLKIQEIMRGNFDNVGDDNEDEESGTESEEDGDEESSDGSYETESDDNDDDDDGSYETESARSEQTDSSAESTQSNNSVGGNNEIDNLQTKQRAASKDSSSSSDDGDDNGSSASSSNYESESGNETDDDDNDGSRRSSYSSSSSSTTTSEGGDYNESDVIMSRSGDDVKGNHTTHKKSTTTPPSSSSSLQSILTQLQTNNTQSTLTITTLTLPSQNLTDTNLIPLFQSLSSNTHIITLQLSNNQLSNEGCKVLASTLLDNSKLVTIDISQNTKIGQEGITELTKALPYNYTLKVLNMSDIGRNFGASGASLMAVALAQNESLREVILNGNEIGTTTTTTTAATNDEEVDDDEEEDVGATHLFQVLTTENTTLEKIHLRNNKIGDKGATALANALLENETLVCVDLAENEITDVGARDILKVLDVNETLGELSLEGNGRIDGRILEEIERAIRESGGSDSDSGSESESGSGSEQSSYESGSESGSESEVDDEVEGGEAPLTGGEAMLTDMPDEDNKALAKRQLIQQIMKDKSLSAGERNKKIQDVMAGRVELPKVEPKPKSPPPTNNSTEEGGDAPLTGGEAMLTDMPDEDNKALAKRQLIQQIMKDKSLSAGERNKKIQDVMAGRIELPKVEPKQTTSETSPSSSSSSSSSPVIASDAPLTGGEAMLTDMPDEDNKALAKRQLIQQIMKDKSLSAGDRNKKIQDVMAGRVELPKVEPKPAQTEPPSANVDEPVSAKPKKPKRVKSKSPPTVGDEERKKALQAIMMDTSLSAPERQQKIQEIMEGKKPSEAAPPASVVQVQGTGNSNIAQKVRERKSKQRRKNSAADQEGAAPTNMIAQEWKMKMMEPHPRSHDDLLDVLLAHKYRLSLKSPPKQSCFRVVAVVFFSLVVNGVRRSERYHVVGTNDEPHSIAGSICAERAALMQLRFMPNLESITKIVIVTDDADAVSPGMLCREFMASHDCIPWDVPIILGRSVCKKCGFSITGNVCGDSMSCFSDTEDFQETQSNIFATCSVGHEESKYQQYTTPHDFLGTATTLRELFPYPSLYTRLSGLEALQLGERYLESDQSNNNNNNSSSKKKKVMDSLNTADRSNDVSDDASTSAGSFRQEKFDLTMLTDILEDEEAENVDIDSQKKRPPDEKRSSFVSPTQMKSSMTHSLKTTIDFMRQIQEEAGDSTPKSTSGLGVVPDSLDRLTATKIRMSSRLKPSQRREKLLKMATEATVYESHQRSAHPIRYGAAVLFSDNSVSIASQKVAIEYGCTLDAVGQLASIIDRKALQIDEQTPAVRPVLLVQCDQFGVAHPPFAQGRAFLTERGYGDCKILLHQQRQSRPYPTIMEEKSLRDFDEEEKKEDGKVDLRLIEVDADGLAPSPPDIFGVVKATKTHSSPTLKIQF